MRQDEVSSNSHNGSSKAHGFFSNAFTLIELSIVVIILSVLIATILTSRTLVDNAKVNKIHEDYRSFRNVINIFFDNFGCLAGDCNAIQMGDLLVTRASGSLNAGCVTQSPPTLVFNTSQIDNVIKRTCMMFELNLSRQLGGVDPFLTPFLNTNGLTTNVSLSDSVAGINIPYANFGRMASWDFTWIGSNSTVMSIPIEAGKVGINSSGTVLSLGWWSGQHMLVLRNSSSLVNSATTDSLLIGATVSWGSVTTVPAVSANIASKVDKKFDDGLPYGGTIMGGKSLPAMNAGSISCNDSPTTLNSYSIDASFKYINSNSVSSGCYIAYLMESPP